MARTEEEEEVVDKVEEVVSAEASQLALGRESWLMPICASDVSGEGDATV